MLPPVYGILDFVEMLAYAFSYVLGCLEHLVHGPVCRAIHYLERTLCEHKDFLGGISLFNGATIARASAHWYCSDARP
jgi:hypothetical protein